MRYSDNGESTLGLLFDDYKFLCYTLEDEKREVKKAGDTRIPEGTYQVGINEAHTGMTEKYRAKPWAEKIGFDFHLHIKNVPNFTGVYIHVGNDDDDTEGCILVADTANNNQQHEGFIGQSVAAYCRLYLAVRSWQKSGDEVYITIVDLTNN